MNYRNRIENLRKHMEETGVDAVLTPDNTAWEYLAGLPRLIRGSTPQRQNSLEYAGLLVTQKEVTALSPRLTAMGFSWRMEQFPEVGRLVLYPDADMDGALFDAEISAQGLAGKRIGVIRDVSARAVLRLTDRHGCRCIDFSDELDAMRQIKDEEEIALMRHASAVTDRIYEEILPMFLPGTPIRDIERETERLIEVHGCSGPSFPPEILNYGPKDGGRLGMPYPFIDPDHSAACDIGVMYRGYCSDFGRTAFLREPGEEVRRACRLVQEAQAAALEAYVPGRTTCREMNEACHGVMAEAGMDEYFIHRMGHGVGMDIHERPFMAEGEDTLMQPGMTFTDEPSLFVPGRFLVRLEDVVLCTEDGFEFLNRVTREPIVLG